MTDRRDCAYCLDPLAPDQTYAHPECQAEADRYEPLPLEVEETP